MLLINTWLTWFLKNQTSQTYNRSFFEIVADGPKRKDRLIILYFIDGLFIC